MVSWLVVNRRKLKPTHTYTEMFSESAEIPSKMVSGYNSYIKVRAIWYGQSWSYKVRHVYAQTCTNIHDAKVTSMR